ncbi:alpha/beta hydrolase [Streptomyces sp. NBC_00654]|uniref:alpha/beta hydrolase n=1 Tax=Streptomyces sp. NBC_00654 TaxID=2975799 RepID=UPI00224C920F|nr:alpha/beta fold hydrolase [Streptomyces sp. NBC_00654]MCX4970312.1 alpha/beta hydrolase [Streptomyces sp. NBC_00654]
MSSVSEGRFLSSSVSFLTPNPLRATLLTDDGVPLEAVYEPCTAGAGAAGSGAGTRAGNGARTDTAMVVAHGFTGHLDRPAVRRAARVFSQRAAVITFSFRGHGRSGGRSTVGDREVLDLAAAVAWARSLGHRRIITVGFSMGGSVVLRHGALYTADPAGKSVRDSPRDSVQNLIRDSTAVRAAECAECQVPALERHAEGHAEGHAEAHADAVVAVSAPARWYYRGTAPMRRLHWVVTRPTGRLVGRYGFRTRIADEDWDPVPLSPVGAVPLIAPAPLLIVHGDQDPYFPLDHPRMLAEAAGEGGADLWLERGMGHAENASDETLLTRIADWAAAT